MLTGSSSKQGSKKCCSREIVIPLYGFNIATNYVTTLHKKLPYIIKIDKSSCKLIRFPITSGMVLEKTTILYIEIECILRFVILSSDIDECSADSSPCDENANCTNSDGSYTCNCKQGFSGNGTVCEGVFWSPTVVCDQQ